ncbi:MAG: hypothetical protein IJS44_00725 [Clostridia bacterium]|nr:hypothetical protein [Clostridia bacterium]
MDERNFCEYAVKKRHTPRQIALYAGVALGVTLAAALGAAAALAAQVGVLAVLPLLGGAGVLYYLSRYLSVEYEFTQTEDVFDVAEILSKKYRREKLSVQLRDAALRIAPYDGELPRDASGAKVYDFLAAPDAENPYYILFAREGARGVILFNATPRMVENLFYQVPSVTTRLPRA